MWVIVKCYSSGTVVYCSVYTGQHSKDDSCCTAIPCSLHIAPGSDSNLIVLLSGGFMISGEIVLSVKHTAVANQMLSIQFISDIVDLYTVDYVWLSICKVEWKWW